MNSCHHGERVVAGSLSRPGELRGVESSGTGASVDHVAVDDHLLLGLAVDLARGAHGDEAEPITLARQRRVRGTSQRAAELTVLVCAFLVWYGTTVTWVKYTTNVYDFFKLPNVPIYWVYLIIPIGSALVSAAKGS